MAQQFDDRFARQFLGRQHAAVNAHEAETVAALCTEDVVWEDPAAPEPPRGRAAVYRFHRDIMFRALPDVRSKLIDGPYLLVDRPGVAVRRRISGTMTGPLTPPGFAPTGGRVEFETAEFSSFDGDLLPAIQSCWTGSGWRVTSVPSREPAASPSASTSGSSASPPAEHKDTGAKAALRFKFAAEHAVEASGHPRYARMPAA